MVPNLYLERIKNQLWPIVKYRCGRKLIRGFSSPKQNPTTSFTTYLLAITEPLYKCLSFRMHKHLVSLINR